jgi:Excalibur calcium-binding domain
MSFRRPFRAVPIKEGLRYRKKRRREKARATAVHVAVAALLGAGIGICSIAVSHVGAAALTAKAKGLAVSAGLVRARSPQPGDSWSRCDEARAAGTAPIYKGEPGYRDGLDADGDGIACEHYPGM